MNSKEYWGLAEAYSEVYAPQEIDEQRAPGPVMRQRQQAARADRRPTSGQPKTCHIAIIGPLMSTFPILCLLC